MYFIAPMKLNKQQNPGIALAILMVVVGSLWAKSLVSPPYSHCLGIRKARQLHLSLFLPFTRFKDPQGLATAKMITRDDPHKEGDDDEVVVYGVNSGKHQLIYNTSMMGLDAYGKQGSGLGEFQFPKGVACDEKGNVFVVDAGNHRVVHLFNPQKKVQWVKAFNGDSNGARRLLAPSQVSLDARGRIYVTDTGNRRIVVFDTSGSVLFTIPKEGETLFVDGPTTIAIADGTFKYSRFTKEQVLFCADKSGRRLWKIDLTGIVMDQVEIPAKHAANYGAVDYYHNFWITDKKKHAILKYSRDLELLDIFGSYGKKDGQMVEPRGIAIWKRYGQTFVAEKFGAQYFWVGTDLKKMTLQIDNSDRGPTSVYTITSKTTAFSFASLMYVTARDTITLLKKRFVAPGDRVLSFAHKTISPTASGTFLFRIEPTYSSYTYYHWDYPITMRTRGSFGLVENVKAGYLVKKKGQ